MSTNDQILATLASYRGQLKAAGEMIDSLRESLYNSTRSIRNKVNSRSGRYDTTEYMEISGTGRVTTLGNRVYGIGTVFGGEADTTMRIEVNGEVKTITQILSDTELIVSGNWSVSAVNPSTYILERPISQEILWGDFDFGQPNVPGREERTFRGRIAANSIFEHFGRQQEPQDIATIGYVNSRVQPATKAAQNAIQRNGDNLTVPSPDGSRYLYEMDWSDWKWYYNTSVRFDGIVEFNGITEYKGETQASSANPDIVMTYKSFKARLDEERPVKSYFYLKGFSASLNGGPANYSGALISYGGITIMSGAISINKDGRYLIQSTTPVNNNARNWSATFSININGSQVASSSEHYSLETNSDINVNAHGHVFCVVDIVGAPRTLTITINAGNATLLPSYSSLFIQEL